MELQEAIFPVAHRTYIYTIVIFRRFRRRSMQLIFIAHMRAVSDSEHYVTARMCSSSSLSSRQSPKVPTALLSRLPSACMHAFGCRLPTWPSNDLGGEYTFTQQKTKLSFSYCPNKRITSSQPRLYESVRVQSSRRFDTLTVLTSPHSRRGDIVVHVFVYPRMSFRTVRDWTLPQPERC